MHFFSIKKKNSGGGAAAKYYLDVYLSKAYLVFLNNYILSYSLILIFYLLLNFYFGDVLYTASGDMEDIRSTIQFYQGEADAIAYQMEEQGLNKDDNMLSPEDQTAKAQYLEAMRDVKEAVRDNIRKLSLLKSEQPESVVTTGKRLNSETTEGVKNTDYKRR